MNNFVTLNSINQGNNSSNNNRNANLTVNSYAFNPNENPSCFRKVFPYFRFTSFCFLIIVINILFYITELIINNQFTIEEIWNCTLYNMGSKYSPAIVHDYQFQRLIMPIFLHANLQHIFMNNLSILFLGFWAEHFFSTTKFIILYFSSGIFAALLSAVTNVDNLGLGASGSIMSISGLYLVFYSLNYRNLAENERRFFFYFLVMTAANLFTTSSSSGNKIDIFAHMGGFICGIMISVILYDKTKINQDDQILMFKKARLISYIILPISFVVLLSVLFFILKVPKNIFGMVC